ACRLDDSHRIKFDENWTLKIADLDGGSRRFGVDGDNTPVHSVIRVKVIEVSKIAIHFHYCVYPAASFSEDLEQSAKRFLDLFLKRNFRTTRLSPNLTADIDHSVRDNCLRVTRRITPRHLYMAYDLH